ncbi:MAG: membrane protein insertase YidC [Rhodospirillaceae bacterium]
MNEQKNLVVAVALSIAILLGFQLIYEVPRQHKAEEARALLAQAEPDKGTLPQVSAPGTTAAPVATAAAPKIRDRGEMVAEQAAAAQRLKITTPRINGTINRTGGRIDDISLVDYHETPDPKSGEIVVLAPAGTENPYYAEFGWVPAETGIAVPDVNTVWAASGDRLTPDQPVTLSWDNGHGLVFERTIAVDLNFMFRINDRVRNTGSQPVTLLPYGLISRQGTPKTAGYYILHEGPIGILDGTLTEVKYKDLSEKKTIEKTTTGGWIGITDKYWLVTLVPDQQKPVTARFLYTKTRGDDRYQVDILGEGQTAKPGETIETKRRLFAGAKEVKLLDAYAEKLDVQKFDLAVDFGWFYFLTKPFFYCLDFLHSLLGNFGIAILVFTVLVKAVVFPLANQSYRSMSKMKQLQPQITQIRERCGEDKERMNKEMMELYKREKANPLAGCLPILVQIPVFFALYKVLFVTIEMRHAPFFGWIHDLSAPDPTSIFNLFGLLPFTPPTMLMIGVWPLVMGFTMWFQQKLNPTPPDPMQQKMFAVLPFLFTYMLASFPAGLVIYWAWNNLLSIGQQWLIMRGMGVKVNS